MSTSAKRLFETAPADNDDAFTGQDWMLVASISLIWGASFVLIAEALEGLTPGMVTLLRVGFGAVTLAVVRRATGVEASIAAGDRVRVGLLSLVWVAIPFTLFPLAQQWINSAVTGLLNGATPVFVAVISAVFVRVVPNLRQRLGLVLGFGGIALISLGSAGEGASQAQGVALVLAATICYGFAFNIAPPLQAKYGAVLLMSTMLNLAALATVPYALVDFGDNEWKLGSIVAVVALGAIGTGIAYWIMATLVGRVGSIRASLITYLIPVVSLLLGIALRGDDVGPLVLVGAPLTILGAFLASRRAD